MIKQYQAVQKKARKTIQPSNSQYQNTFNPILITSPSQREIIAIIKQIQRKWKTYPSWKAKFQPKTPPLRHGKIPFNKIKVLRAADGVKKMLEQSVDYIAKRIDKVLEELLFTKFQALEATISLKDVGLTSEGIDVDNRVQRLMMGDLLNQIKAQNDARSAKSQKETFHVEESKREESLPAYIPPENKQDLFPQNPEKGNPEIKLPKQKANKNKRKVKKVDNIDKDYSNDIAQQSDQPQNKSESTNENFDEEQKSKDSNNQQPQTKLIVPPQIVTDDNDDLKNFEQELKEYLISISKEQNEEESKQFKEFNSRSEQQLDPISQFRGKSLFIAREQLQIGKLNLNKSQLTQSSEQTANSLNLTSICKN
ncbi:hypothetical protein FGO68_gene9887 [Halteria grandinella]|uniref:Uncharacterized protein n=1 Tax=Halteria grandinella TaxID=5974 RepID=A0A8J8T1Z6_HALGN|nr:hypothetical protein FGO68_gene9887 [Halteria grandinella]